MASTELHPHIQNYLKSQQSKSEGTVVSRRSDLRDFQAWMDREGHSVEDATPWILDDYFTNLQAEGYAPNTIDGRWETVRQLYQFLTLREEIAENPMEADELRRRNYLDSKDRGHVESQEIHYVTKDEMEKLAANVTAPKLRNRLLIRLLFQTGMRANEVTRVRLKDMDRSEHSIEVFAKKTGDKRTVYYHESLDFLLDEWLEGGYRKAFPYAQGSEYLFVTRRDGKMLDQQVNKVVRKAAENAGNQEVIFTDKKGRDRHRITGHTLRHGHAVYSLKCGIDVRVLQKHLGHESLEMTMRYLKLIDEDVRDAYRENWGRA